MGDRSDLNFSRFCSEMHYLAGHVCEGHIARTIDSRPKSIQKTSIAEEGNRAASIAIIRVMPDAHVHNRNLQLLHSRRNGPCTHWNPNYSGEGSSLAVVASSKYNEIRSNICFPNHYYSVTSKVVWLDIK